MKTSAAQAALDAVEAMEKPFDPHGNSAAWLVYRYPQLYELVKGQCKADDVYIESRHRRDYDKHFFVEARHVEAIREHYAKWEQRLAEKTSTIGSWGNG